MKKVKYITAGLALCGLLAGMTGCGTTNTDVGSVDRVAADKGSAVVSSGKDMERSRYANHNNIYDIYDISEEEDPLLVQMKPDETVVQRYEIEDLVDVVWVTDEWVYYLTQNSKNDILWRIPVEKAEDGDRLESDRAEKLFEEEELLSYKIHVTDNGVFYVVYKEDIVCELRYYDFTEKKSEMLKKSESWMEILHIDGKLDNRSFMLGDNLFFQHDDELYALDTVNTSLEEIYKGVNAISLNNIVECEDSVYFLPDYMQAQVYQYDGKKVECVIAKEALKEKMHDLDYPVDGEITINKIFVYNDRMYFYIVEQNKNEDYWYYEAQLLLSAPVDDLLNLEGDEKFSHYMEAHNTSESYDYETERKEALKVGISEFFDGTLVNVDGGWGGKLILKGRYFVPTSGVGYYEYDYAVYDLDTGEVEETDAAKAVQNKDADALLKALASSPWLTMAWR